MARSFQPGDLILAVGDQVEAWLIDTLLADGRIEAVRHVRDADNPQAQTIDPHDIAGKLKHLSQDDTNMPAVIAALQAHEGPSGELGAPFASLEEVGAALKGIGRPPCGWCGKPIPKGLHLHASLGAVCSTDCYDDWENGGY